MKLLFAEPAKYIASSLIGTSSRPGGLARELPRYLCSKIDLVGRWQRQQHASLRLDLWGRKLSRLKHEYEMIRRPLLAACFTTSPVISVSGLG